MSVEEIHVDSTVTVQTESHDPELGAFSGTVIGAPIPGERHGATVVDESEGGRGYHLHFEEDGSITASFDDGDDRVEVTDIDIEDPVTI